jgi:DNA polymerase III epsilon subunit family exonuclease
MPFSLVQPLASIPIAAIDVETTGASAALGDRIIEIGIARFENGVEIARYERLLDPRQPISRGVSALTGITQAMCDGQPTFAQVVEEILPLLRGAVILGHNIRFDLSFLVRELRRCGCDIVAATQNAHVLDTMWIARRRFGRGGNGLGALARRLGFEPPIRHRALPDAQTAGIVLGRLLEPVGGWAICLCDALREQGGPIALLPASPRQVVLPLALEEALDERCAVMMEYLDGNLMRTQRVVEPLRVRRIGGELVLIAHCRLRDDRRHFKLERIVELKRMESGQVEGAQLIGNNSPPLP